MTPGAFDAVEGGQPLFPMIAVPPTQGAEARAAFYKAQSSTYGFMYRTQPAVRKVIDYIARNASQIGMKFYERIDDQDRQEAFDHPAALSVRRPNGRQTGRRFMYGLIADYLIYWNAYAVKFRPPGSDRTLLWRPPVWMVEVRSPTSFRPGSYRVHLRDGTFRDFAPADVIHVAGYDPDDPNQGLSPLETLRQILAEEAANQAANVSRLKQGGLGPGWISRGLEAPEWKPETRERFEQEWAQRARGRSEGERVDPVLEEDMEFHESSINPRNAEYIRARIFTRSEAATAFGLPVQLISAIERPAGGLDEARTQFYADCLPPLVGPLADDFTLQLAIEEYGADDHYFEFDIAEKLRGQIEERFKVLVSAAGGPILTRNEARRRENLPEVDGGDELITPMNVTVGGKPSPGVMPVQDPNKPSQEGDEREAHPLSPRGLVEGVEAEELLSTRREAQRRRRDRYADEHTELLRSTFGRQERSYRSSKRFDLERWNAELADDLEAKALATVEREGGIAAERLANPDGFDLERVKAYLRRGAEERAEAINRATAAALEEAAERDGDEGAARPDAADKQDPFEHAKGERADEGGAAIATSLASFAHLEAGKQSPDAPQRLKTWVVTSSNSRHPQLQGETVPVFQAFSNGGQYPGDPKLGTDETARCQCLLEVA